MDVFPAVLARGISPKDLEFSVLGLREETRETTGHLRSLTTPCRACQCCSRSHPRDIVQTIVDSSQTLSGSVALGKGDASTRRGTRALQLAGDL
eukprot:2022568-Amphidinium_carterae.1